MTFGNNPERRQKMNDKIKIALSVFVMLGSFALLAYITFLGVSLRQYGLWTALGLAFAILLIWRGFSRFKYDYNAFMLEKFRKIK
jgi:hypothetical protein